jgi:hypothetical protein
MEKTQHWLEATTGSPKTEEEAKWFLAFWATEGMNESTRKEVARSLQYYCEHGISYNGMQEDFFTQMQDCKDEGEYREEDWEGYARNFYDE